MLTILFEQQCFDRVLSQLLGEENAADGGVGMPLPGVAVRVRTTTGRSRSTMALISQEEEQTGIVGDLLVKGPGVFQTYWNRLPSVTAAEFTSDGFFKTGDIARVSPTDGTFSILGRSSVDILKIGGFKVSALEVERVLLSHPSVSEASVIGIPDVEWGQRIIAVIVADNETTNEELRSWCFQNGPRYRVPKLFIRTSLIEKNAMGKVNKKSLAVSALVRESLAVPQMDD